MNLALPSPRAALVALLIAPALLLACAAPVQLPEGAPAHLQSLSSVAHPPQAPAPVDGANPRFAAPRQAEPLPPAHLQRRLVLGRLMATPAQAGPQTQAADSLDPARLAQEHLAQAHLAQALAATDQFTVELRSDLDLTTSAIGADAYGAVDVLLVGRFETWPPLGQSPTKSAESSKGTSSTARFVLHALDPRSGEPIVAISTLREAPHLDEALAQAATEAARALAARLAELPWQAYLLRVDGDRVRLSVGEAQGLRAGTELDVQTLGDRVRSRRSGLLITLPGQRVARLRVDGNASARLVQGSVAGLDLRTLVARLPSSDGAAAGFSGAPHSIPSPPQPTRNSP